MSDGLYVRRYEPSDADRVWTLHERALRDAGAFDEAFADRDADLRRVRSGYLDAGGEFLVGEADGELIAMGAFQPATELDHADLYRARGVHGSGDAGGSYDPRDTAVIRRMRVDPDHQREGYGSAVLRELETRAHEAGFERAALDATPTQEAAMAFYPAHGYVELRRWDAGPAVLVAFGKDL